MNFKKLLFLVSLCTGLQVFGAAKKERKLTEIKPMQIKVEGGGLPTGVATEAYTILPDLFAGLSLVDTSEDEPEKPETKVTPTPSVSSSSSLSTSRKGVEVTPWLPAKGYMKAASLGLPLSFPEEATLGLPSSLPVVLPTTLSSSLSSTLTVPSFPTLTTVSTVSSLSSSSSSSLTAPKKSSSRTFVTAKRSNPKVESKASPSEPSTTSTGLLIPVLTKNMGKTKKGKK